MASPLPNPRLVTTTHTSDGISRIASDARLPTFSPYGPQASAFTIFHSSSTVPISNTTDASVPSTTSIPRCPPNGTMFCTTDIAPGHAAPMHRTESTDYACVLDGEITMRMDGGDETVVSAGEMIVQRGTNHTWINNGKQFCRILFVMIGCEKVKLEDGRFLEATKMGPRKD